MSGDVQPRKRKDKKKRKEDDGYSPLNDDVNIHVHKEGGTGGNICAKIVFFLLFSALIVLIGLIIKENQGLTELEGIEQESRYSQIFEGWVDNHPDAHEKNHEDKLSQEDDDHDLEEDDHDLEEDDHDLEEDDHDLEEDDHEESIDETEEQSEEASEEEKEDSTLETEEEDSTIVSNEEDSTIRSGEESEEEEQVTESAVRSEEESEEEQQVTESDENIQTESDEVDDKSEEEEEQSESQEKYNKKSINNKSKEKKRYSIDLNDKDNDDDNDDDAKETEKFDENRETAKDDDSSNDNKSEELDEDPKATDVKESNDQEEHEEETVKEAPAEETDKELLNKSSGTATKIGVGVALLAVAYNVFFRKRNPDNPVKPLSKNNTEDQITPDLSRRNTIVPPLSLQEVEADLPELEAQEEEYSEGEEYSDEDSRSDHHSAREDYQELRLAYARSLESEGNFDIKNKNLEDVVLRHDDDIEEEEIDEQLNEEEIDVEYERYDEEEDDDDEDEELLKRLEAKYGKLGRDVNVGEEIGSDSGKEDDHSNVTDKDDYNINVDIEAAEKQLPKNAAYANKLFDALLDKHSLSPRILYGKAHALDLLAEEKKSNELLQQAIAYYIRAINVPKIPDSLFVTAAERYIDRTRFLGHYKKAIAAHWQLIERFPDNPKYLNNLAVTYLTINLIEEARSVLKKVLEKWPKNGFALVHYGFLLKTADNNLKESVDFMYRGLKTKEPGVTDGRFYFHLGDALTRLNRHEEAAKLYEEGVQEKVFMSKYQRSLYNVPRLTAKPWWEPSHLPAYQNLFLALKKNWQAIRKEGLAAITAEGYFRDEAENLKDTGTWKQLELFARGQKFTKNCVQSPITCGIIQQFPEARSCRRGQTKFSIMHPGTHVWPHCGPTNCRLRIHLGLKVPPNTFIRVAEETRSWMEGEIIIFDDSFEHEVWHNGSEFRLILIVDVWHPELTSSERKGLSSI